MNSIPQSAARCRPRVGPAQLSALRRWHGPRTFAELQQTLQLAPHFPLIDGDGRQAPPRRRGRSPQGGPGHAA